MRRCVNPACGAVLGVARRAQIRTCSSKCRVAVHRAAKREAAQPYPAELRQKARWVRRSKNKVPLRADGQGPASSTDRGSWSTFEAASGATVGVGVGFVLNGDGIVCLDLDHCITDGRIDGWAQDLLDRCPPTWVEVSASGTGLHIWGRGHVGVGRVIRRGAVKVEVYGAGRYIALGTPLAGAPRRLADLGDLLQTLRPQ